MASPTLFKNAWSNRSGVSRGTLALTAILCGLALVSLCQFAAAQDYSQGTGAPTYTTAEPVELGFVNAGNGNLHMEIPMASFPQRAGKPLSFKLVYDSRIWYLNSGTTWDPNTTASPWGGWRYINPAGLGAVNFTAYTVNSCTVNGHLEEDQGDNNFSWQAPDGTMHYFGNMSLQFSANCGGQVAMCTESSASDGSGYYMIQNDATSCQGQWPLGTTILGPDGTQVYTGCTSCSQGDRYYDTNGNYFSLDSNGNTIDTLGRTPVIVTSNCGTNQTCYDVLNSQGGSTRSRWIVTTESISVHTAFGDPVGLDYQGVLTVIQKITLPDGTLYNFTYDSGTTAGHYGEVTGITLPDGGQITYGYTVYQDALSEYNHWVTKHISGGGTTTYYLGSINTSSHTQNVTVTEPSSDYKIYAFTLAGGLTTFGAWKNQVSIYSNGGSLIKTVADSWGTGTYGTRLSSETVTLETPTGSVSKQTTFAYNNAYTPNFGTVKEWNYYTGSPSATPDRITNFTYLSDTNTAYGPSIAVGSPGRNILTLPTSIVVTNGSGTELKGTQYTYDGSAVNSQTGIAQHDDTGFGTSFTTRGNRTLAQQWTSGSTYLTTATMTYDMTGQMASSKDANNNQTSYSYTDCYLTGNPPTTYNPTPATNAYLTTTTLAASGTTKACYYYNTGKTAWTKDQNSATTSYFYVAGSANDPFDRLITETLPTGGWVLNNFSAPATTVDTYTGITDASPSTSCVSCRHGQMLFDGLARPTDQILVNDPDGLTTVHTDYDTSGRVLDTSHPYRTTSDSTYGFETPSYDGMNRITQVLHQDGTKTKIYYGADVATAGGQSSQSCPTGTCHLGYPTLTVDESGKIRQIWTDGFGNVVEADEPTASATTGWGSLPTTTYYLYDLLGNLTQATVVNGQECNRTYLYDALSRMTQSTEPEPGNGACTSSAHTTNYYYTTSGATACSGNPSSICRRTDGRGTTTTYTFDALNRPTGMTYSDSTPSVTYFYDQTSYNGLTIANGLGRRTGMLDGSGETAWNYDSHGNIATEKRTIAGVSNTISYVHNEDNSLKSLTYPSGRVVNFAVGNAQRVTSVIDGNGKHYVDLPASGKQYAPTGALASVRYGKTATFGGITETRTYNNRLQLTGVSATSTGGTPLNLTPGYNSNGEIATIADSLDTGRNQSFTYDSLSRITGGSSAATSGADCWGQTFTIDNVANLTNIALSKCSGGSFSATANQNNQLTSYTYDAAGNLTSEPGFYTYTYNAENEITSANSVSYSYDGSRMRVAKSGGTMYWRDVSGNTIAETTLSGADVNEYVFFAGRRVARIDSTGTVYYYQADQIGSTRTGTNSAGILCYDADFTPYGSEMAHATTCAQNYKFVGYERDSETGLDYAMNRYYNSRIGRFMSPDPSGIASASPSSPQSLNFYSYVLNNPLGFVDPNGLDCVYDNNDGTVSVEPGDCFSTYDNGYYIDATIDTTQPIYISAATGDLSFSTTDGAGAIVGFEDPVDSSFASPDPTLDNRAKALGQALNNVPGLKKTTLALNCLTLGVGTAMGVPTSVTGAPSYPGLPGTAYVNGAYNWVQNHAPALGEFLDSMSEKVPYDFAPLAPIAGTANTTARCYNANGAGGTNHP